MKSRSTAEKAAASVKPDAARRQKRPASGMLIKFRDMMMATAVLAGCIAIPLLFVWKQASMTATSVDYRHLSDSLAVLKREVVRLKMTSEALSSIDRIEPIARTRLGLEYPISNRIVIIAPDRMPARKREPGSSWGFLAILKRSLSGKNGST